MLVGERIYREVKARLLTGEFVPGGRLDINALAAAHDASTTTVREVLSRLVGEALLETHSRDGFHTPRLSEDVLRDLYAFNGQQLVFSLRLAAAKSASRPAPDLHPDPGDVLPATERLFAVIATGSGNVCISETIKRLNDHLRPIRRLEPLALSGLVEELADLSNQLKLGDLGELTKAIVAYHARRQRVVPALTSARHQPFGHEGDEAPSPLEPPPQLPFDEDDAMP